MRFHAACSSLLAALAVAGAAGPAFCATDGESTWYRQRPGSTDAAPLVTLRRGWWAPPHGAFSAQLSKRPFNDEIVEAARRAGIDPALVHAVIGVESAYNAKAVSHKGAVGLMQVVPGTARRFGVDNLLNPKANIRAGTQYLSHLMRVFDGDLRLALAAYNAGEYAVLRYGRAVPPYRETRAYVPRVLGIYEALLVPAEAVSHR
jgi:soluble lytic murein transglycosylase-like protein